MPTPTPASPVEGRTAPLLEPRETHASYTITIQQPGDSSPRQILLDDAARIVSGARETTYGGPEKSFTTIAALWSAYAGLQLAPHDVAAMQALVKLARIKGSRGEHRDSWVDLAGYAACGAECVAEAGTGDS